MRLKYYKTFISFICMFLALTFPKLAQCAVFEEVLPAQVEFSPITLNGEGQSVNGGQGKISVKATNLLGETWNVTVQGNQLTQVGGSGLKLPVGSLQLNTPILESSSLCDYTIGEGPWSIDNQEPIIILDGGFYPLGLLLGWATFYFDPSPFTLSIYPNVKMIDPGYTTATYTTTITWTLTFAGL